MEHSYINVSFIYLRALEVADKINIEVNKSIRGLSGIKRAY